MTISAYVRSLDNKNLVRFKRKLWKRIDNHYSGAWDWTTLHVVFPQYANTLMAINREVDRRLYG